MIYSRIQTDQKVRIIIFQRNKIFNIYYLVYLYLKYYVHNVFNMLIYNEIYVFTIIYIIRYIDDISKKWVLRNTFFCNFKNL